MKTEALYIIKKLHEHSFQAVYAGGYVRDTILGVPSHDIDIATDATPEQVESIFDKTIATGKVFGVIRVQVGDEIIEVATFRKDGQYTDGRRPDSVEFCSMKDDVLRRDFTINGMLFDPITDEIIDFVGGREDLKKGLVRFIGDADSRIAEDKLRMLRGVRFAARFGSIEPETLDAIKRHAKEIHTVSAERIQEELVKMLKVGKPRRVVELLFETGLMHEILPEVEILKGTPQDPKWHPEGDVLEHTIRVMEQLVGECDELLIAGMFHDIGKPDSTIIEDDGRVRSPDHAKVGADISREIMKRMKFSTAMVETVSELVYEHMKMISVKDMKKASRKKFFAQDNFQMLLKLHEADRKAGVDRTETLDLVRSLLEEYSKEPIKPKPFVDGRDIIDMGIKEGKEVGKFKEMLYDMQLEGEFKDREQALERARQIISERG